MDYILSWIKNIVYFFIFTTIIYNVLPNGSYKKYIKLFVGIVMIIFIMYPLGKMANLDEKFTNFYSGQLRSQNLDEIKAQVGIVEDARNAEIINSYTEGMKNEIKKCVEDQNITYIDSEISLNLDTSDEQYGSIERIDIKASRSAKNNSVIIIEKIQIGEDNNNPSEDIEAINIKNYLADFYNIPKANIYVNIYE